MDLEQIAEDAVPGALEAKVGMGLAKAIVIGIAVLILAAFLGWVVWKLLFSERAAQAKHDEVQAKGETAISNAGANAGKDAIPIINNNYYGQRASDAKSQENRNAILQAPGASTPLDPSLAALVRRDICLRASASSLPECRAMLGVRP